MLLSISTSRLLTNICRSHFILTSYTSYIYSPNPFLSKYMLREQLSYHGHGLILLWLLIIWLWLFNGDLWSLFSWLLIVVRLSSLSFGLNKFLFLLFTETNTKLFSLFDGILELSYIRDKKGKSNVRFSSLFLSSSRGSSIRGIHYHLLIFQHFQ